MTGDKQQNDQHPREHRPGNSKDESDASQERRNRGRRSGGGGGGSRRGVYRFEDNLEHDICQLVTHRAPRGFPVTGRPDIATMPPTEVARTETRILLCDRRHDGPHLWPNGDEVPE